MGQFVLNRNYNLRSTAGHIVDFKKGEPTWVPPALHNDAVAIGAEPLDGVVDVLGPEDTPKQEMAPDQREAAIMLAFEKILRENERGSFTASGMPNARALQQACGMEVSTRERQDLWQKFREAQVQ